MINRDKPAVFGGNGHFPPKGWPGGFIFSPAAPILCGFGTDAGSGTAFHGGCDGGLKHPPLTLEQAMRAASRGYNEIIVGDRDSYMRELPRVVEVPQTGPTSQSHGRTCPALSSACSFRDMAPRPRAGWLVLREVVV
jgi:hypothetical protein